jgi:hypothetical protein
MWKTGDAKQAFDCTRFLTRMEPRTLRDLANRLLEVYHLPSVSVMRHVRDWLSRRIGAVLDHDSSIRMGYYAQIAAEMGHHSVLTSVNWYTPHASQP